MQTDTDALLAFRKEQEKGLTGEDGWLSITALSWLKEGENSLPAPLDALGVLVRHGAQLLLQSPTGGSRPLKPGIDTLTRGTAVGRLIQRGTRLGVRVYDSASPARKSFKGQVWFAPDSTYRLTAAFHPYPPGKTLAITNVLGDTEPVACPGYVTFTLQGKPCRLEAQATPTGLFFNFRDQTSGKETYPAGRFLETEKPDTATGTVEIDFNRAVNPPCAFTAFATCPLPPRANVLAVSVRAGEKNPH